MYVRVYTWLPGHGDETKTCQKRKRKRKTKPRPGQRLDGRHHLWLGFVHLPRSPYPNAKKAQQPRGDLFFQDIHPFFPSQPRADTFPQSNNPTQPKRRETRRAAPHRTAPRCPCTFQGEALAVFISSYRRAGRAGTRSKLPRLESRDRSSINPGHQRSPRREIERDGGCVPRGGGVRLPVQGGADRGQRRGQVEPAVAVRQGRVQPRHQVHHRRRVRHQDRPRRRKARQGADLGHRRPGKVPSHHQRVLPRGSWRAGGVRRDPPHHVRERAAVADGAPGPHGRQHRGDAGREQGGPAPPEGRHARGVQGLCGGAPHILHGDVRAGVHQRGGGLHGGARGDLPRRQQEDARHRRRPGRAAQGQDHQRRRRLPGQHRLLLLGLVVRRRWLVMPCACYDMIIDAD